MPNYTQYQLSSAAHLVMPAYNLDSTQFSILFSSTMIAGIFLSLVAVLLCDRFGVKRIVGIAGIISVVAIVARVFASSFGALFACMALAGVLATFLNANLAKIMGSWFPPEKVGLAVGIGLAGATLSMAVGLGTSALFPSLEALFVFTAAVAAIALLAWWLFFKDGLGAQVVHEGEAESTPIAQPSLTECLKVVLKSRNVWLIGIALGMDMAAACVFLLPEVLKRSS